MKNSRTARAKDLAEWFRAETENGVAAEADLMARAALALERIANERNGRFANDNSVPGKRRARR